jgi:uncharacterized protein (TIGR03000 family)
MRYGEAGSYPSGYYMGAPYGDRSPYYGERPLPMPREQDRRGTEPDGKRKEQTTPERSRTRSGTGEEEAKPPSDQARGPAAATIVVSLPADAKLMIEDQATRSTSDLRTFISPPLEPGKEFEYTLKAELSRGGRAQTTTTKLTIRAGEESFVTLEFPGVGVARR